MRSKKCFQAYPSVFFNPTKLVGFICSIGLVGLILGRPSFQDPKKNLSDL